jgi:hypothetical protein
MDLPIVNMSENKSKFILEQMRENKDDAILKGRK